MIARSIAKRPRLLRLVVLLGALGTGFGAVPSARAALQYSDQVVERTLENGFKIILLEDHKAPVAVVQVWYRVGSRNEIPGLTGLSHMLEHMLFKGTEKYGPGEYTRIIARNGGDDNAFTTDDTTMYFAKLAADRVDVAIDLESDRMRGVVLSDEQFDPERQVVMEERRMRVEDNPIAFMSETLRALTFREHPYRQPTIGWAKDIAGWKLADLKAHYDLYYRPRNAFIVVVGDFDAKVLGDKIAQAFGTIEAGPEPPPVRAKEGEPRGPRRVVVERPARLPFVAIEYVVPNLHSPDSAALSVLENILSGGKSARLYRDLVQDQRIALDASANYERTAIDDKTFLVAAQAQPGIGPEKIESALLDQIEAVRKTPPTEAELERAKARIESSFVFAQDSVFYRGFLLGMYELAGGWRQVDDYLPQIAAVKPEDVQRVAQEYLGEQNRSIGILIPQPGAEGGAVEKLPGEPLGARPGAGASAEASARK